MNVSEKISNAVTEFEKLERLYQQTLQNYEDAKKELAEARKRLARTMHAAGELEVRAGRRTYAVQGDRDEITEQSVYYTEFSGRIL